MTQAPPQPWWPPLDPEEKVKATEAAACHLIEARRLSWEFLLKQALGFWELPARKQLTVMLEGIDRMRVQLETNPELAMYGPVRPDVAYFDALRAIDGEESQKMLHRFIELVERYAKDEHKNTSSL